MYTQEEIKEILKNKNVLKCSEKSIGYAPEFKIWAVKKYYEEGCSPKRIFEEGEFDLNIIGRRKAKECIERWRRTYNKKGEIGLLKDHRHGSGKGGRPAKKEMKFKNDKEKIRYLEAKIAYMDAENDFLAKLRGLKRK